MWGLILVRHHGPSNAHSVLSDNKEQEWVLQRTRQLARKIKAKVSSVNEQKPRYGRGEVIGADLAGPMPPDVFEHRYMVIALDLYSKRIDVTPIV
eukprot:m.128461 g.128461  ORF g.128461 m.128461 type:complete len:95 (-) comp11238_c0_seq2:1502-1786(-)